jgi:hypothetical protein
MLFFKVRNFCPGGLCGCAPRALENLSYATVHDLFPLSYKNNYQLLGQSVYHLTIQVSTT